MAVDLVFRDDISEMVLYANIDNKLYIGISAKDDYYPPNSVLLSKEDAIKLVKELKKQINFLSYEEK